MRARAIAARISVHPAKATPTTVIMPATPGATAGRRAAAVHHELVGAVQHRVLRRRPAGPLRSDGTSVALGVRAPTGRRAPTRSPANPFAQGEQATDRSSP